MPSDKENAGLRLLKKRHKGLLRLVFSRTALVTLLLLINFSVLLLVLLRFST